MSRINDQFDLETSTYVLDYTVYVEWTVNEKKSSLNYVHGVKRNF